MCCGLARVKPGCGIIQREAEAHFAGRGDGGMAVAEPRDAAGEVIGAVVAAQQRHGGGAVFRHGDHRRLAVLVPEVGRHGANEDARRAEADDGAAFGEQLAQMGGGLGISHVAARHAVGRVDLSAEWLLQLAGERQGGGAEHEEDGLHHVSAPE